jgi:hypothetical protein
VHSWRGYSDQAGIYRTYKALLVAGLAIQDLQWSHEVVGEAL